MITAAETPRAGRATSTSPTSPPPACRSRRSIRTAKIATVDIARAEPRGQVAPETLAAVRSRDQRTASASDRPALPASARMTDRKPFRWHILVFLAPAVLVYTAIMIVPLFATLNLSLFRTAEGVRSFVGLDNFRTLFGDPRWSASFWNALGNNVWFFLIHMLVQNPIGVALAALLSSPRLRGAAFYRTAIFIPTILSFVIVGFVWKLILSPIWGIAPGMLASVGLKSLFAPWLGQEATALTTLALISVWQFVGIPMMLIYAALLSIPDEVIEAAEMDGITGWAQFWKIKLPLILPVDRHHLDPDLRRQLQRLRPDLRQPRARWPARTSPPTSSAPSSTAPSSASSCRSATRTWARRSPPRCSSSSSPASRSTSSPSRRGCAATSSEGRPHVRRPAPRSPRTLGAHAILIAWTVIALFPVFVIVVNAFKNRRAIFSEPLALPAPRDLRPRRLQDRPRPGRLPALLPELADRHRRLARSACCSSARWPPSRSREYRFRGNTPARASTSPSAS